MREGQKQLPNSLSGNTMYSGLRTIINDAFKVKAAKFPKKTNTSAFNAVMHRAVLVARARKNVIVGRQSIRRASKDPDIRAAIAAIEARRALI